MKGDLLTSIFLFFFKSLFILNTFLFFITTRFVHFSNNYQIYMHQIFNQMVRLSSVTYPYHLCPGFHQNSIHCSMATKVTVESRTISLYMCRGNHIHILNCKKTTTKGGSTSIFKSDCFVLVCTKIAFTVRWPQKRLWKVGPYHYTCVVKTIYIS